MGKLTQAKTMVNGGAQDASQNIPVEAPNRAIDSPAEGSTAPVQGAEDQPGPQQEKALAGPDNKKQLAAALVALHKVLYVSVAGSRSVLNQLLPNNKEKSVAAATVLIVGHIAAKIPMRGEVVLQLAQETVTKLIEMFTRVKKVIFSTDEANATFQLAKAGLLGIMQGMVQKTGARTRQPQPPAAEPQQPPAAEPQQPPAAEPQQPQLPEQVLPAGATANG